MNDDSSDSDKNNAPPFQLPLVQSAHEESKEHAKRRLIGECNNSTSSSEEIMYSARDDALALSKELLQEGLENTLKEEKRRSISKSAPEEGGLDTSFSKQVEDCSKPKFRSIG